jgi:hypothetical protein
MKNRFQCRLRFIKKASRGLAEVCSDVTSNMSWAKGSYDTENE